eukprot:scaffold372764_cov45-Prasinocladus_malaysianus.AAC.1
MMFVAITLLCRPTVSRDAPSGVKGAAVVFGPLQHLHVTASGCRQTRALVPGAAIVSRPF